MFRRVVCCSVVSLCLVTPVFAQAPQLVVRATAQASRPYESYQVRVRNTVTNAVVVKSLTPAGTVSWDSLPAATYVIELLDPQSRVVCVEGPVAVHPDTTRDVQVTCGRGPAIWWLMSSVAGAGITAAIVAQSPASASR